MLWIGTSGWQYRDWKPCFYPAGMAPGVWLEHYAARFRVVEVNNTFYHLPKAEVFAAWRERTPDDFIVAPKMSRYLTHIKRLRDPEEPVQRFMDRAARLGSKLGPVLLQLPPDMEAAPDRLAATLALFPRDVRVAVEFRHASWYSEEVRAILTSHEVALCLPDRRNRTLAPWWTTAPWGYVRFHEGVAGPRPCYGRQALAGWVARLSEAWPDDRDVYVFFNNDPLGCALRDATVFAELARDAGLRTTRVPAEAPLAG